MYQLINCLDNLFKTVLQVSITSSIIITLILIISKLLKGKLGVKFQYALWFIVIFRLLIPTLPKSSFSIFNLSSKIIGIPYLAFTSKENTFRNILSYNDEKIKQIYNTDIMLNNLASINFNNPKAVFFHWSALTILCAVWIFVMFIISLYILSVDIKFKNKLKKQTPLCNKEIIDILHHCKKQMQINSHISIITTEEIKSPALFGYFKPIILLPENILRVLPINKLRYVFLHELSHFKRKDILVNWIISILRIIHWFNPLIQYGLKKMYEDMEICCDSLALSYTSNEEKKEYGLTIINLIEKLSKPNKLIGASSITNSKSEVKRRIIMIKLFSKKSYKISILAIGALIILGCATLTNAQALALKNIKAIYADKIDYPFINDPNLVGRWASVDFVNDIEDFKVGAKSYNGDLYVKELNFTSDGKVSKTVFTWTKNHILNPADKTDSKYVIKNIDGSTYMFFEWKSGDYTMLGMKPSYYVLKKISSIPSLTTNIQGKEVTTKTDKIDYPFVNDSKVIGKWESVDFIEKIQDFKPGVQQWSGDLFIDDLIFNNNGKIDIKVSNNNTVSSTFSWTKGLIINTDIKTASKYVIQKINGTNYMFFEWKNGDYVERGAVPYYYVLKQVN
ncbi:M56 family metallopeptidase [Clostridium sp. WILCCON 0269]|uniref:M56 family metallopeptidase n=1 Tax=Candidatus Clostridium eludens TaxID=3381663 RepID=A0ABW8SG29_9CLOT